MNRLRKSAALAVSAGLLSLGLSAILAESTSQLAGAITNGARSDAPGSGTGVPPSQLGGLAMTAFPTDPGDTSCALPNPITACLETSAPGPSGENVSFSAPLWHQTGVESFQDGFTGSSYQADNTGGPLTTTLTMPANTRAFYFYVQGNSFTITANDSAGNAVVGLGAKQATEVGFYTQDGSSITSITVADSGVPAPNFTDDFYGQFAINVAVPVIISAPSPTITYGGVVPTPVPTYSTGVATSTPATCAYSPPNPNAAGMYTITCSGAADPDYLISYAGGGSSATGTLTIQPAPLQVTPDNQSMTFGGTAPTYTASFSGLVNGDTQAKESALTACVAGPPVPPVFPGKYNIDCIDSDPNYASTDFVGTLTINTAPLTVTANNASMTYGGAYPMLSASFSGLVLGESAGAENALTTCLSAPTTSAAGSYPINCTDTDPDYGPFTYMEGTLTIAPAPLTITAPSLTLPYGSTIPPLVPIYSGLVNGDVAPSTPPACTTFATSNSSPGSYPVTCTGASDPNYVITNVAGILKVVKAPTSFKVTEFLTKTKNGTTAVLGETGLPAHAVGYVFFQGPSNGCTIYLTGQPGEATTCFANFGTNVPYVITGIFFDTDGNYLTSNSTNALNPHGF